MLIEKVSIDIFVNDDRTGSLVLADTTDSGLQDIMYAIRDAYNNVGETCSFAVTYMSNDY